jgi:hypothetical protein
VVDYRSSFVGNAREELTRFQTILRFGLLALLFAAVLYEPVARGAVRMGDATYVYELERHANAMAVLARDLTSSIDSASDEERFNLYWTYNQLMGTWLQIDLLEGLLEASIEAVPTSDEEDIRRMLRDQIQFAQSELDHTVVDLARNVAAIKRYDHVRLNDSLRSLFMSVKATVERLMIDQCAPTHCAGAR